jgi:hypothetical protein
MSRPIPTLYAVRRKWEEVLEDVTSKLGVTKSSKD